MPDFTALYERVNALPEAPADIYKLLAAKCEEQEHLKQSTLLRVDPYHALESGLHICVAESIEDLELYFSLGPWGIRQGIVYKDLAFICLIEGSSEFWVLKRDGDTFIGFDSFSMKKILQDGELREIVERLVKATPEQCRDWTY